MSHNSWGVWVLLCSEQCVKEYSVHPGGLAEHRSEIVVKNIAVSQAANYLASLTIWPQVCCNLALNLLCTVRTAK